MGKHAGQEFRQFLILSHICVCVCVCVCACACVCVFLWCTDGCICMPICGIINTSMSVRALRIGTFACEWAGNLRTC